MVAHTKNGLVLYAKIDRQNKPLRIIADYKTTGSEWWWNQKRADNDEQMSFYAWVYKLNQHAYPSEIWVVVLNHVKGTCKVLKTVRGPKDIEAIENNVNEFVEDVKRRGWWERRVSRQEKVLVNHPELALQYGS